jgi:hypothetical protein
MEVLVMYHANVSPQSLSTVVDPLKGYPARWELMRWYTCWRKTPYVTEAIAALVAEARPEGYAHYPCPLDASHWHIGRGGRPNPYKQQLVQAKRVYRKAVRDEKIEAHRVARIQQEETDCGGRGSAGALAD